ncbi:MAG: hypothetical protein AAF560_17550 [Acidobacteriota bacterium]
MESSQQLPGRRAYALSAVLCSALFALPFLLVTYPPITDLPQQMGQIRLLLDAWGGDEELRVHGFHHPNKLSFALLLVCWWLVGPPAAGRLAVYLIGLLWVAATHALAYELRRPPWLAALAALCFFNHITYWGFLNFLLGLPVFAFWFLLLRRLDARAPEASANPLRLGLAGPALLLGAALLYSAHVLWLGAGLGWLGLTTLARWSWREIVARSAWVAPVAIGAVGWWYAFYAHQTAFTGSTWGALPWQRLNPGWLLSQIFGGLRGPLELVILAALIGLAVLGLWQQRHHLRRLAGDSLRHPARSAWLAGLCFLGGVLVLPEYHHTTAFAGRWLPVAVVFLVLSIPPLRLKPIYPATLAALLVVALISSTSLAWLTFDRQELAGVDECLEALPEGQRLLGLAFIAQSSRLAGHPFHHIYAWGQVLRDAELNRSFAAIEPAGLVVYHDVPRKYPWTEGLDFFPHKFRAEDRDHFQYLMIYAMPGVHASFLADPNLEPVTPDLPWRLYRVLSFRGG